MEENKELETSNSKRNDSDLSFLTEEEILKLAEREKQLAQRREMEKTGMESALDKLGSVFGDKEKKFASIPQNLPPLVRAVALTARATGININFAENKIFDQPRLDDVARYFGFRYRNVILSGKWWKKDNGSLFATLEKDKRPVALLPVSARKYVLIDPASNRQLPVTKEIADSLSGQAFMFYRPFPNKPIKLMSLLGFGLKGCLADLGLVAAGGSLAALLGLLVPIMTGTIVNTVIPEASRNQLLQICLILAACAFCVGLFKFTKAIALVRLEGRMDINLQAAVWDRIPALPAPFFRNFTAGDLANRSMGINAIRQVLSGVTVNAMLSGIFSLFSLGLMFYYSPQMALVALVIILCGFIFSSVASYFLVRYQRRGYDIRGRLIGLTLQFIMGVGKLKVTGAEDRAFARWAEIYAEKSRLTYVSGIVSSLSACFNSVFPLLTWGIIFWWYFNKTLTSMPTGDFLAFHSAFATFLGAMLHLGQTLPSLLHIVPLYERARPILEALPETDESKAEPGNLKGAIEVSMVSFRYASEAPLILNNLSLKIYPGEFVAFVGGSGSGKSTLLRLLLGFEQPDSGAIFYDGQDLNLLDLREVRRQLGVVLQDGSLMQGSIFENIIGSSGLGLEQAEEAARMVGLDKDIVAMPMGMHTVVSPGGGTLSGGQCQRIMIAKALVKRPKILFMDEATSALDNETQKIVADSLAGLNVTRLVIAHRLSTIREADRIAVLKYGQVTEIGTHDELMDQKGAYYELVKRQIA